MAAAFLEPTRGVFGFERPREHDHSVVRSILAMGGSAKAAFRLRRNLAIASSDPQALRNAIPHRPHFPCGRDLAGTVGYSARGTAHQLTFQVRHRNTSDARS